MYVDEKSAFPCCNPTNNLKTHHKNYILLFRILQSRFPQFHKETLKKTLIEKVKSTPLRFDVEISFSHFLVEVNLSKVMMS